MTKSNEVTYEMLASLRAVYLDLSNEGNDVSAEYVRLAIRYIEIREYCLICGGKLPERGLRRCCGEKND